MRRRDKTACAIQAARLTLRVWNHSRKTGLPFQPLLEAHLDAMETTTNLIAQKVYEHQVAEIARNN